MSMVETIWKFSYFSKIVDLSEFFMITAHRP